MTIYKLLNRTDVKTQRSYLQQLVDVIQEDISGSTTRRKHNVWVTGGIGPGVTSSLVQTVYDQSFTLQTANAVVDLTIGLFFSGSTVQLAKTGEDNSGKLLFPSSSMMMREKVDIYKQFSQTLLGNAESQFVAPFGSSNVSDQIDEAFFVCFKRLFHRDGLKRETFAMKWYQSASHPDPTTDLEQNLYDNDVSGSVIYTDIGASINREITHGGSVSNIVNSSDSSKTVGLLFNDKGIAVLDLAKIISGTQHVSGVIDAMNGNGGLPIPGKVYIGSGDSVGWGNPSAKFIPDLMVSASIDNILDHLASTRFGSAAETAFTFQNVTNINSTLLFCRATADEFNYSSNPTFVDSDSRIVVIDEGQEDTQRTFAFVTAVGLYDANNNLLAVAKTSRPIEKSDEKDLTLRIRLDY